MQKCIRYLSYAVLFLINILGLSAQAETALPLSPERAFIFSASMEKPGQLLVEWEVAPGYYLYRDKIHITASPSSSAQLRSIGWPPTKQRFDTLHGTNYRAYDGLVRLVIPVSTKGRETLQLKVTYQGCSQEGFCYAPMKKHLQVAYPFAGEGLQQSPLLTLSEEPQQEEAVLPEQAKSSNEIALLQDQAAAKSFLGSHGFLLTILVFLGLGVLLAFTPCVLPMLPILSALIVGQGKVGWRRAGSLSLSYVLGMALSYAAAGMAIAGLGSSVQAYFQNPWMLTAFSLLFVLLALSMLGLFNFPGLGRWQQKVQVWQEQQQGGTYLSAFLMGGLSTLVISPCVTAPLVGVLAYVTETGNWVLGGSALFALGLGMGLPLLALGFSAGKFLPKSGLWMESIKKLFAFMLLGLAIWILGRVLPGELILFLWACLFMAAAVYLLFAAEAFAGFWRGLSYLIGVFFVLYGFVLFVGVALSYTSPFYPLEKWAEKKTPALKVEVEARQDLAFVLIQNMAELNTQLAQAKRDRKPVVLDFYADWCESCQAVEKKVLSEAKVKERLASFVLLRANVSENNAFDRALLKRYQVIAPPTFLFFNREGKEQMDKRVVGEVDHHLFLARAENL